MSSRVTELNCVTFEVRFDGFEGLPSRKGRDWTESPDFTSFGHQWYVRIYPGGTASSKDGKVAIYLYLRSSGSISGSIVIQPTFTVNQSKSKVCCSFRCAANKFPEEHTGWGTPNLTDRSKILGALKGGALIVEVQMKRVGPSYLKSLPFVPSPLSTTILNKFMDKESADVVFEVTENTHKKEMVKVFPFYAHRFVLPANGALAEACELSEDMTPIRITDVKPSTFHHLLLSLYGGEVNGTVLKKNAKDIIDAADKFGVVGLKLAAEAAFVTSTTITIDNVLDILLYADSKNCALLKEAAIDAIVENGTEAMTKLSFQDVPGSMITDVLAAMCREKEESTGADSGNLRTARVSTLRKMLHEKGLDVDGSREAMMARLEENVSDDTSESSSDDYDF